MSWAVRCGLLFYLCCAPWQGTNKAGISPYKRIYYVGEQMYHCSPKMLLQAVIAAAMVSVFCQTSGRQLYGWTASPSEWTRRRPAAVAIPAPARAPSIGTAANPRTPPPDTAAAALKCCIPPAFLMRIIVIKYCVSINYNVSILRWQPLKSAKNRPKYWYKNT